jgi:hypothetical protein
MGDRNTRPRHNSERPIWTRWPHGLVWLIGQVIAYLKRWTRCFITGHRWNIEAREDGEAVQVRCRKCNTKRFKYATGDPWPYGLEGDDK